jgi:hypothetical protein
MQEEGLEEAGGGIRRRMRIILTTSGDLKRRKDGFEDTGRGIRRCVEMRLKMREGFEEAEEGIRG